MGVVEATENRLMALHGHMLDSGFIIPRCEAIDRIPHILDRYNFLVMADLVVYKT